MRNCRPDRRDRPSGFCGFPLSFWNPLDQVVSKGGGCHYVSSTAGGAGGGQGRKVLQKHIPSKAEMYLVPHASQWGVHKGSKAEMAREQGPEGWWTHGTRGWECLGLLGDKSRLQMQSRTWEARPQRHASVLRTVNCKPQGQREQENYTCLHCEGTDASQAGLPEDAMGSAEGGWEDSGWEEARPGVGGYCCISVTSGVDPHVVMIKSSEG